MALDLDIHLCDALNTCFAVASDVRSIPPCAVSAALLRVSEARVPLAPLETGHIPTADALLNSYEPRVACGEERKSSESRRGRLLLVLYGIVKILRNPIN